MKTQLCSHSKESKVGGFILNNLLKVPFHNTLNKLRILNIVAMYDTVLELVYLKLLKI